MIEQFLPTLKILGYSDEDIRQYDDEQYDYLSIDLNNKGSIKLGVIIDIAKFFTDRFDIGYKLCDIITENNKLIIRKEK